VIEKSAQDPSMKVKTPGSGEMVDMKELCISGGIINAYEAIKLAATLKPETRKEMKSKVKKNVKG